MKTQDNMKIKTRVKTKTFQEGDDITPAMVFVSDILWADYVDTHDWLGEEEYTLKNKITITIKIHNINKINSNGNET